MEWLQNNFGNLLVGAILIIIVAFIVKDLIKNRGAASSCNGQCGSCAVSCSNRERKGM